MDQAAVRDPPPGRPRGFSSLAPRSPFSPHPKARERTFRSAAVHASLRPSSRPSTLGGAPRSCASGRGLDLDRRARRRASPSSSGTPPLRRRSPRSRRCFRPLRRCIFSAPTTSSRRRSGAAGTSRTGCSSARCSSSAAETRTSPAASTTTTTTPSSTSGPKGCARRASRGFRATSILNARFFDSIGRNPEWREGQEARWYQAPFSALSFNDNVVMVSIRPGVKARRAGGRYDRAPVRCPPDRAGAPDGRRGGRGSASSTRPARATSPSGAPCRRAARWWSAPIADRRPAGLLRLGPAVPAPERRDHDLGETLEQDVKPDNAWTLVAETESGLLPSSPSPTSAARGSTPSRSSRPRRRKVGSRELDDGDRPRRRSSSPRSASTREYDLHDGSGLSPQNRVAAGDIVAFLRAMNASPTGRRGRPPWPSPGSPREPSGTG